MKVCSPQWGLDRFRRRQLTVASTELSYENVCKLMRMLVDLESFSENGLFYYQETQKSYYMC